MLVQSSPYTTYKRQHIRVTPLGIPNVFFRSLSVFFRQVSRRRRCFRWKRQRRWVCWRWRRCHASHADCSGRSRLKTIEAAVASIAWKKNIWITENKHMIVPAFWNCQTHVSAPTTIPATQILQTHQKNICKYLQSQAVMCLSYLSVILHTSLFQPNRAVEHQHHHHHSHKSNQNQGQHQNHHPYPHPYRHPHPHPHQHCHHPILIIHPPPPPPHYHHHPPPPPYPHQHRHHRHHRHDYTITITMTMTMTTTIMASLTIVALSTQPVLSTRDKQNREKPGNILFSD